jgi:hypothetical protein
MYWGKKDGHVTAIINTKVVQFETMMQWEFLIKMCFNNNVCPVMQYYNISNISLYTKCLCRNSRSTSYQCDPLWACRYWFMLGFIWLWWMSNVTEIAKVLLQGGLLIFIKHLNPIIHLLRNISQKQQVTSLLWACRSAIFCKEVLWWGEEEPSIVYWAF